MKRGLLIVLLLLVCVTTSGCALKLYFGGWATSSGKVVGPTSEPISGVSIVYTSVSDPSSVYRTVSAVDGTWRTNWLKLDMYTVAFAHPDFAPLELTAYIDDRGVDTPMGTVTLPAKASEK